MDSGEAARVTSGGGTICFVKQVSTMDKSHKDCLEGPFQLTGVLRGSDRSCESRVGRAEGEGC